ncbi:hypothetical protein KIN20_006720 [Parelaphostrongylus tenuis]|uniref:Uncharacterized protein n=1 Tax=Parelaphostrongylus tenuis TaxID=148309 RepID=A0AAD5QJH9_PARTN|nr:hypothetical protein KIN20_006720 [Parelaphostrongylus tenuis]
MVDECSSMTWRLLAEEFNYLLTINVGIYMLDGDKKVYDPMFISMKMNEYEKITSGNGAIPPPPDGKTPQEKPELPAGDYEALGAPYEEPAPAEQSKSGQKTAKRVGNSSADLSQYRYDVNSVTSIDAQWSQTPCVSRRD